MAFLQYLINLLLFFIPITLLIIIYRFQKHTTTVIPTNGPTLCTLPRKFGKDLRLYDYTTKLLIRSYGTLVFKGPWFANMNMLFTTNPLDIHHILSKNFNNYPKGDKFRKIFDILGDGILNTDGKMWEINQKVLIPIFKNVGFQNTMETIIWNKLENGLLPILESTCGRGAEIDLQDIFQRFAYDTVWKLLFDDDPKSLSLDFPNMALLKAFTDCEEACLLRHIMPPCVGKLQQILRVGNEKKLSDGWKIIDQFIYNYLAQKQKDYKNTYRETERFIFLTAVMKELQAQRYTSLDPTKFLRDTFTNLMAAGKDTVSNALSWFFYLLARNPTVEDKILEEMQSHLEVNERRRLNTKELDEMVYLHGAICESLRLYPPVPFNHKSPLKPEVLPSGHQVDQNTKIIISFYSMGRMKSIWGEDCMEFKPERWISDSGGIKHEPSYKFPVFNAGPRTCLGKNMALSQLKIVSTAIIYHYHIQIVEDHPVLPANSMVLHMKYGLKVRLNKRIE